MAQPDKNRSFYSKYFREGEVLHGLQVQPDDREWVLSVPKDDVSLEEGISPQVLADLDSRGHNTRIISSYYRGMSGGMGGAQLIQRDLGTGVLHGASEPRKDGCAIGW